MKNGTVHTGAIFGTKKTTFILVHSQVRATCRKSQPENDDTNLPATVIILTQDIRPMLFLSCGYNETKLASVSDLPGEHPF